MTPQYKLKQYILTKCKKSEPELLNFNILDSEKEIDKYWNIFYAEDIYCDYLEEFRAGEYKTDIQAEYSRHYESYSVATQMLDGNWIGWTYWFGGGKYGEPEAIEWIEHAYELEHLQEEKMVIIHSFKKVDNG